MVGGREIHPVNVRVGGFYRAPRRASCARWSSRSSGPASSRSRRCAGPAASSSPTSSTSTSSSRSRPRSDYPLEGGRLVSTGGLDIAPGEYEEHFEEEHVAHSTALHSRLRERGTYLCGPLARYALNSGKLSPLAREAAAEAGLGDVCRNPFRSIVVRSVEILYALDEALRLIADYEEPDAPAVEVEPRAGIGCGWTEAPRGMLWHRYRLDEDGTILEAKIVPPTSQNQASIEADLRGFVAGNLELEDDRCGTCASRRSATTTRASRARRTS